MLCIDQLICICSVQGVHTASIQRLVHRFYFWIPVTCIADSKYLPDNGFAYWNMLVLIFM